MYQSLSVRNSEYVRWGLTVQYAAELLIAKINGGQ